MTGCTNIAFVPIDNRPVCFTLAKQIAEIDPGLNLLLPPREFLGDLAKTANIEDILNWLENLEEIDKVIVSLDTIAYGGLIPSRRSSETFEEIKSRIDRLKDILLKKSAKVYAFSSIMRISNNNINEEEKEYWNLYGEKIFKYSYEMHKNIPESSFPTDVPSEIIQDYLLTRKRNFEINHYYLELSKTQHDSQKFFETLVFSKDDCAQFGLNVAEAQSLETLIKDMKLDNVLIKTGADEIPLSLLSRALTEGHKEKSGGKIKISPVFTNPDFVDKISKYEDVSVFESVKGQIELAGAEISETKDADLVLLVNNFKEEQGELVMGVDVEGFEGNFSIPPIEGKPFLIVDILNANGADNNFVKKFLEKNIDMKDFLGFMGYSAWNTTGNSLGSGLCCAIVKFLASKDFSLNAFKKVQAVRFLDDWAYQANVRKKLKSYLSDISTTELKKEMRPYEKTIGDFLDIDLSKTEYTYPWNRFFETEVTIK